MALCKRLTAEAGVTAIPISAFYASDQRPHHLVRYAAAAAHDCVRPGLVVRGADACRLAGDKRQGLLCCVFQD